MRLWDTLTGDPFIHSVSYAEWSYRRVVKSFYSFLHLFIDSLAFIHDYEPYNFAPERIDKSEVAKSYAKAFRTTFERLKSIWIFFYS